MAPETKPKDATKNDPESGCPKCGSAKMTNPKEGQCPDCGYEAYT